MWALAFSFSVRVGFRVGVTVWIRDTFVVRVTLVEVGLGLGLGLGLRLGLGLGLGLALRRSST